MADPIIVYGNTGGSWAPGELPTPPASTTARRWRIVGTGLAPVPVIGRTPITPTGVTLDQNRFLLVAVASAGGFYVARNTSGVTAPCAAPVGPVLLASYAPVEFMEIATERLGGTLPANATEAQAVAKFLILVTDTWGWVEL